MKSEIKSISLLHLVGDADLGCKPSDPIEIRESFLAQLKLNPVNLLWGGVRDDHRQRQDLNPFPAAIDRLEKAGYTVDRVVFIATDQQPNHPRDTLPIAQTLAAAVRESGLFSNDVTTEILVSKEVSIAGFRAAADDWFTRAKEADLAVALPYGSGPVTGMNAIFLSAYAHGVRPLHFDLNDRDDYPTLGLEGRLDIKRWLFRRRMWSALSNLSDVPQPEQEQFRVLAQQESIINGRRAANQDRLDAAMFAAHSALIRRERTAPLQVNFCLELYALKLISEELLTVNAEELTEFLVYARRALTYVPETDSEAVFRALCELPHRTKYLLDQWVNCPDSFRSFYLGDEAIDWLGFASLYNFCTDYRHRVVDDETNWTQLDRYFEALMKMSNYTDLAPKLINNRRILRVTEYGPCRTTSKNQSLSVRLIGMRNRTELGIDDAIDRHSHEGVERDLWAELASHVNIATHESIGVSNSTSEKTIEVDVGSPIKDIQNCIAKGLRDHPAEIEVGKDAKQISDIIVYLSQGSKKMNLALIIESLAFATETDTTLQFFEAAAKFTSQGEIAGTEIRATGDIELSRVSASLFGQNVIAGLMEQAIRDLNITQARNLLTLLPPSLARSRGNQIKEFLDRLARPGYNLARGARRLEAAAPHVELLRNSFVTGTRLEGREAEHYVGQLSTLLSDTAPREEPDGWKKSRVLRPLWDLRNQLFHSGTLDNQLLRTVMPIDSRRIISEAAKAMNIDIAVHNLKIDELTRERDEILKNLMPLGAPERARY